MARFDNKVIVVTGASRGIGGSIAEAFLHEGATVVGLARTENKDITGDVAKRFISIAYDLGNASAEQLQQLVSFFNVGEGGSDNVQAVIRKASSSKPGKVRAQAQMVAGHELDEAEFVKF